MKISLPELSLVLLVGPSGSGKSSFARKHFLPTEVVSSDFCRALVSDNENDQSATADAFDLLHEIVRKRLARGRLTVVDATNVQPEARKSLIALAKEFHLFAEAIVFDLSERVCQDQYCWPVRSLSDLKLAPFHILASEGAVHTDKPHTWHMELIAKLCGADTEILLTTPFKTVDLHDEASTSGAVSWWEEMTAQGREGMVVKPFDFIAEGRRGVTQPAIKCRGAEYLRILYGPEYLLPTNLERLRSRNVGAKRSLASREFALSIEALERFVRKEPLRLTHECVFGVLALES